MENGKTDKKILLFGFDDLRTILEVKTAVEPFGAELIPVGRSGSGKTLAVLCGLEEDGEASGGPVPGRMAVLYGLENDLDALLPAMNAAGANCLKAILTPHNRTWTPSRLYWELSREQEAIKAAQAKQP